MKKIRTALIYVLVCTIIAGCTACHNEAINIDPIKAKELQAPGNELLIGSGIAY